MRDYIINDSWDWVTYFEKEIAEYCGSKYAVACDSNSNAIKLVLEYLKVKELV
jgi:dTDP-4-amino-4,6-dideoxygalactose transaminase